MAGPVARVRLGPIVAAAAAALPALGVPAGVRPAFPGQLAAVAVFLAVYVGVWRLLGLDPADRAIVQELTGRTV